VGNLAVRLLPTRVVEETARREINGKEEWIENDPI
jgi:hypothetical protein